MSVENRGDFYKESNRVLKEMIPKSEWWKLDQFYCELEPDFLGFTDIYYALSKIIPKNSIVIDFGCYMAAQQYYFKDHVQYIGVDNMEHSFYLERFGGMENAVHYKGTIQRFLTENTETLFKQNKPEDYFAICSYVPDDGACEMVRKTFPNVFCIYPHAETPNKAVIYM